MSWGAGLAVSWLVGHEDEEGEGKGSGDSEEDAVGGHGGAPWLILSLRRMRG